MGVIDDLEYNIKHYTGEEDRRRFVAEYNSELDGIERDVKAKVNSINHYILQYNSDIEKINTARSKEYLMCLKKTRDFLKKFGNVKPYTSYMLEDNLIELTLPEHPFESEEEYLAGIDWTRIKTFNITFWWGPTTTRIILNKKLPELKKKIGNLKSKRKSVNTQLDLRATNYELAKKIADTYLQCVNIIENCVNKKIIPELEVIDTFFETLALNDSILAGKSSKDIKVQYDIRILPESPYSGYYQFIQNAFLFYVMASKMYSSSILTDLLKGTFGENDLANLLDEKNVLKEVEDKLLNTSIVEKWRIQSGK